MEKMNTSQNTKSMNKKKNRDYQPLKPDPTSDPDDNVVASRPPTETEIGSSIVRRNEADDED